MSNVSPTRGQRTIRLGRIGLVTASIVCAFGCRSQGTLAVPGSSSNAALEFRGQNEEKERWADFLDPKKISKKAKVAFGYGPDRPIAERNFQEGEAMFVEATKLTGEAREDRFEEAAKKFEVAADRWPDSTLEEDALFMLSESNFFANRYPEATSAYELLVKKYPNTRHMDIIDRRRFAIGKYWVEHHQTHPDLPITPNLFAKERPLFDKFGNAIRVFDKIRYDAPMSRVSDDATLAAGIALFREEKYQRADELFTDLRQTFPDSEHQFQAHLLGVQCKLKIYQGPDYSVTPMDEAEQLIRQMARLFPQETQEHREFLTKAWQQVRLNKAQHDFQMARYYHRRKEFEAARQYYARVRDNYSDTSLGKESVEILAEIGDAPPKPDQALPWLANLFPTPEREKPLVARNPLEQLQR